MGQVLSKDELLYSRLGDDPDLGEIVTMFVEEMPDRMATLLGQFNDGDLENLRRTAHQLKGAAGSYGFDLISPAAAQLESVIRDEAPLDQIRAVVEDILHLCQSVRAGARK